MFILAGAVSLVVVVLVIVLVLIILLVLFVVIFVVVVIVVAIAAVIFAFAAGADVFCHKNSLEDGQTLVTGATVCRT